jgi:hypothetical protein
MLRAIFSLIIKSISTVFTASGIIHVCRCRLMPEAVNTVEMLLMMSENIARNM